MTEINHHIPENLMAAYAAGTLGHAFSVVVAAHVSLCLECRARLEAHEHVGGAVLEDISEVSVSADLKSSILARIDLPAPPEPQRATRSGIFPAAVMATLKGRPPKWKPVGGGIRQCIIEERAEGSLRLLYIPSGRAVPDHGHGGLELTLVLQGSFSDASGAFGVGDVEVAAEDVEHVPIAGEGLPCICLAASDAPLRFRGWLPRLLQPVFRI